VTQRKRIETGNDSEKHKLHFFCILFMVHTVALVDPCNSTLPYGMILAYCLHVDMSASYKTDSASDSKK